MASAVQVLPETVAVLPSGFFTVTVAPDGERLTVMLRVFAQEVLSTLTVSSGETAAPAPEDGIVTLL